MCQRRICAQHSHSLLAQLLCIMSQHGCVGHGYLCIGRRVHLLSRQWRRFCDAQILRQILALPRPRNRAHRALHEVPRAGTLVQVHHLPRDLAFRVTQTFQVQKHILLNRHFELYHQSVPAIAGQNGIRRPRGSSLSCPRQWDQRGTLLLVRGTQHHAQRLDPSTRRWRRERNLWTQLQPPLRITRKAAD